MKKLLWLIAGAGIGFLAARRFASTSQGRAFFDAVDARTSEFRATVVDSYHQRQADLRAAIGESDKGPRK
ncbi:hypothetical protein ACFSBZ_03945 [Amnibacterium flavum]|nr:hypothetical protein [Amnibacterium flavum]